MAQQRTQPITQDKFLLIAVKLLHRALVEPARTTCKRGFRELCEGRRLPLSRVSMPDGSTARFVLVMDYSEFRGRLNFGAFRASLETLLNNLAAVLKAGGKVPLFNAEHPDAMIFGITAVTVEDEQPNVMVLGTEPDDGGTMVLKLMYLDPAQFREGAAG